MHAMLSPGARQGTPLRRFARTYRRARETATVTAMRTEGPREPRDDSVEVPLSVSTRVFGDLRASVTLPIVEGEGGEPAVAWAPHLAFPGMRAGRAAEPHDAHARAGDDPGARRHADRAGRGTAVRARPARLGDRGPRGAGAAGAGGGAAGPGRPGRHAGRPDRARARVRPPARRHARRHPAGGNAGAGRQLPAPGEAACGARSTPRSSARRSRRWPAATAASPRCGRATARCSRSPAWRSRRPSRPARCSRSSRSRARSRRAP